MKINQELKSLNEQQFLEVVSKSSYLLVGDAQKLLKWFGVELFVINHIKDEQTTMSLITKEANGIGAKYPEHIANSDGYVFLGTDTEKIMCMAFFGKYVPVSILFHELGHWVEYVGHYEKDYDLYGKDIVYAHGHIGNYVIAYDFTEAKAWVYGVFAARIIDNSSGSVHYYSCLEQMCYENSSDNFQRPVSDLAVYMLQRSVGSIKTKKSKKPLATILKHARPIIDVLEAEAFRYADHEKDISVLLKTEPDRFEIEDDWF